MFSSYSESPPLALPTNEALILDIVLRARAGDESSFNSLYHWYYADIYRHLVWMVGDPEDVSDLTQETFCRAWRGLAGMYDGRRFRGWLYRIATNAALDHLRRKTSSPLGWGNPGEDAPNKDTDHFEGQVEERELIKQALKQVAPKPRACLILRLEGFSKSEIATFVGLRQKSVGTYVSIARVQFRQAYNQLKNT
jgi:RNA polymerase sigma-70 factor (ECF subfamily)